MKFIKSYQISNFLNLVFFFNILLFFSFFSCDASINFQTDIQDTATYCAEWMVDFYDLLMADLILVVCVVLFLLMLIISSSEHHKNSNTYFSHSQVLEVFWTIVPAIILLAIAYPSFNLLYSLDDFFDSIFTVKIIGHQWYWSYELLGNDYEQCDYDAYMCPTEDLSLGEFRLLTTDMQLALPMEVPVKLLITSADVLHSWTVPSFGIKVDACPGRLNEAFVYVIREGLYFGQCSEICGVNHGFMPIMVRVNS